MPQVLRQLNDITARSWQSRKAPEDWKKANYSILFKTIKMEDLEPMSRSQSLVMYSSILCPLLFDLFIYTQTTTSEKSSTLSSLQMMFNTAIWRNLDRMDKKMSGKTS